MKTVGPFVAARPLDRPTSGGPARPVVTLHALDRLTGMPALVYLLPAAQEPPQLPISPSLLPYLDTAAETGPQGQPAYLACELPPHAGLASDPLQTALGGLRALNALHEAGLIHGGVGPYQLWEWDGAVRLAGAGLPWGEAAGALAAPEGGSSPAADLYALGVTLLRMGPLPVGLSDLLSPYPAQRPSARDALARFNAGPPLPNQPAPLMVQAPLHPRTESVTPPALAAPPLIADPDERVKTQSGSAHHSVPILSRDEVDGGDAPPETLSAAELLSPGEVLRPATQEPPETGGSELLNFLAAFPTEGEAAQAEVAGSSQAPEVDFTPADSVMVVSPLLADEALSTALNGAAPDRAAPDRATPDEAPLEIGSVMAGAPPAFLAASPGQAPETRPGLGDSAAVPESAEMVFSAWPAEPEAAQPTEQVSQESAPPEPQTLEPAPEPYQPDMSAPETIILAAEPLPLPNVSAEGPSLSEQAAPPADVLISPSEPSPQPEVEQRSSEPSPAPPVLSPRQLRPVKIGWSQDGSWQVKKGAQDGASPLVGAGSVVGNTVAPASKLDDGPPPFVRQSAAAPSAPSRFNPLWLVLVLVVVAIVLVVVLARTAFRSSSAALSAPACCTVSARVVGSGGQSLSAPVRVSVGSAPAGSRLSAGTLIGQAPGPLALDVPGAYALKVEGDGYAAQTVKITVPTTQPLVITLQ